MLGERLLQAMIVLIFTIASGQIVSAAEVTIALPTKSFQQIIFPLAQERSYMRAAQVDGRVHACDFKSLALD